MLLISSYSDKEAGGEYGINYEYLETLATAKKTYQSVLLLNKQLYLSTTMTYFNFYKSFCFWPASRTFLTLILTCKVIYQEISTIKSLER